MRGCKAVPGSHPSCIRKHLSSEVSLNASPLFFSVPFVPCAPQLLMDLATWGRHVAAHASPHAPHRVSPAASPSSGHTPYPPPPPSSLALRHIPPTTAALDAALPHTSRGPASAAVPCPDPSPCPGPDLASSPSPFTNPWPCLDPGVSLYQHSQYQQAGGGPAGPALAPWSPPCPWPDPDPRVSPALWQELQAARSPAGSVAGPRSAPCPWPGPDPRVSLALGRDLLSYLRACSWRATREALEGELRRLAGALGVAGRAEAEEEDE